MMEKRAFHPLKERRKRPESSKQAEAALAWVFRILRIGSPGLWPDQGNGTQSSARDPFGLSCRHFRRIWLTGEISRFCYLDHSITPETGALS
jgi:hypothetical protein